MASVSEDATNKLWESLRGLEDYLHRGLIEELRVAVRFGDEIPAPVTAVYRSLRDLEPNLGLEVYKVAVSAFQIAEDGLHRLFRHLRDSLAKQTPLTRQSQDEAGILLQNALDSYRERLRYVASAIRRESSLEDVEDIEVGESPLLFVSHSSQDVEFVVRLVDLLTRALRLSSNEIRCTSLNGYRLPAGATIDSQLRREVNACKILIGVLSEYSLESMYVLFELGARWGTGRPFVPILTPTNLSFERLGPLQNINVMRSDDEGQIWQLLNELSGSLRRPLECPAALSSWLNKFCTP